ncbi:MAG: FAD-binding protein [Coriobacteriia bacterium]
MDRRSFLKGAAAASAVAALGGVLSGCGKSNGGASEAEGTATTIGVEGYMCQEDWLGKAPEIADSEITDTVTVDVVVLGGGHAGTHAALGAAQQGATVAVVEKQPEDKLHYIGEDICNYNSQWMIDKGFGPYNVGDIVEEYCRRGGNRVSAEIVRQFVANSGEMFDTMVSLVPEGSTILDPDYYVVQVSYANPKGSDYPVEQGGYKNWAGVFQSMGKYSAEPIEGVGVLSQLTEWQKLVLAEAVRLGAKWYFEHTATVLTQGSDGSVTGAIAKNADGKYVKFVAKKGVLLTCGDVGQNTDMAWQLITDIPEFNMRNGGTKKEVGGFTTNDGSGLKMGCWAGGYLEPNPRPTMAMGGGGGGPWGTAPFLWLNAEGKRYMNEASTLAAHPMTLRQPVGVVCTVTDSKWLKTVQNASIDHGAPNYGRPQYYDDLVTDMAKVVDAGKDGGKARSACIAERMQSTIFGAPDLKTALTYAGYTGEALDAAVAAVAAYNELCYAGKDNQYGKEDRLMIPIDEAPFYCAPSANSGKVSVGLVSLFGLVTDGNLNVLDHKGAPIKGLYAAGNCLGQRYGNAYSTPTAGNSMGMAMTHGRVAGKIMAAL